MEEEKRRHVGIDLGKREYTMAVIGKNRKMTIHHGKTCIQGRQAWGLVRGFMAKPLRPESIKVAALVILSANIIRSKFSLYFR